MLKLFFDFKMKQGQRAELVTGIFQQNAHFIAKATWARNLPSTEIHSQGEGPDLFTSSSVLPKAARTVL